MAFKGIEGVLHTNWHFLVGHRYHCGKKLHSADGQDMKIDLNLFIAIQNRI
jgi:hypothetical protein